MEINNYGILNYYNYDIEKVLDEFNNYYNIKQRKIPIHFQTIYLYFSNLSERSLRTLIQSNYNIKNAKEITRLIPIYQDYLTKDQIIQNMNDLNVTPMQYYGLISYSYYFYEVFLYYIRNDQEKQLIHLASRIPIIEYNLKLIERLIKSPQQRTY